MSVLADTKRNRAIINYRETYCTPGGRETLVSQLKWLGFFDPVDVADAAGVARQNFARQILENLGVGTWTHEDHMRFVDAILGIPVRLDEDAAPKEG